MATLLLRFRKPGGFFQLLSLIETCEPAKQKNLLHLIGSEDPGWAYLVQLKMISIQRVLGWPAETLMEITAHMPDRILAAIWILASSLPEGPLLQEKWLKGIPSLKAKEVKSIAEYSTFTASELQAAGIRVVQIVRDLEKADRLHFVQFDPSLEIDKRVAA